MDPDHYLTFGPFRLEMTRGRVWRGDHVTTLRPRSLAMLRYLVAHPGRLVTKAELRQHVWAETSVTDTVLRVCVQEIRAALGDAAAAPQYLETVGGQGYWLRVDGDPDAPPPLATRPLVGRQGEVEALERWFQRASQGARQLVFVSGDVGIGKTTLIDQFLARRATERRVRIGRGHCVEASGAGEPYLPLLEAMGQLARGPEGSEVLGALRRYAPLWLAQLPGLESATELERLHRQLQGTTQVRMVRELAELLDVLTADRPLVLVLEDLHWSDRSTVECLAYLGQRREPAQLLVLGTYRPVDVVIRPHPLRGLVQELCGRGQGVELRLELLPAEDVNAYLAGRLGAAVAAPLAAFVRRRTEGNALFMVNIVEHLVQQGLVVRWAGQWTLGAEAGTTTLPEGLRELLLRRIEALPPKVRQVIEAASVVGEEFAVAAVAAGAQRPVEDVETQCEGLAAQHHFIEDRGVTAWPDGSSSGRYRFQHGLYPQVLYEQLGTGRRMHLHRRIATRLEAGYGGRAGEVAAQLATHFERGGQTPQAIHYWQQVGANAARRHAYPEAIAALRTGLALLATLPDTSERTRHELAQQLILGELLMAVHGMASPEAGEAYTRAHALCQHVRETPQHFQVLWGLCQYYRAQAHLRTAEELSQQLFHLGQCLGVPILVLAGHVALGTVAFYRGNVVAARAHLEASLDLCVTSQPPTPLFSSGYEPGVMHGSWFALVLWLLGYADQAQQRSQGALALAQQIGHPPSQAVAAVYASMFSQCRRDAAATYTRAAALVTTAAAQGFENRVAHGHILQGWALAMQGEVAAGITLLRQGLAATDGTSLQLFRPYFRTLLAEACGQAGQPEAGLQVLAEALTLVTTTEERWWEAEVYRLKGALLLQRSSADVDQADACFQQALDVARRQQAKALELRAALSRSRLWQQQGRHDEARQLLAPIYGWFTEGFDTRDVQEAKGQLETLSG